MVRENQGDYDFIHFVYIAKNITQQPTLCEPEKCEGWEWMSLVALDYPILPGHRAAIELYQNGEKLIDIVS